MLTSTYIHVQGVGYATEKKLWQMGALTWHDFLSSHEHIAIPDSKKALILPRVEESIRHLSESDHRFFAQTLPPREHWRAVSEFGQQLAFVDIETTGCWADDDITVIGLHDGQRTLQFVKGLNMEEFPAVVSRYKMLVTFFGSGFDLPFIRREFPSLQLDQLHVDLCYLLRRVGLSGGLKRIEEKMGIRRPAEVRGLEGYDAVRLWHEYKRGSHEALELLLTYNEEDVVNMKPLLWYAYTELTRALKHHVLIYEPDANLHEHPRT